jgi:hypothetical protein
MVTLLLAVRGLAALVTTGTESSEKLPIRPFHGWATGKRWDSDRKLELERRGHPSLPYYACAPREHSMMTRVLKKYVHVPQLKSSTESE